MHFPPQPNARHPMNAAAYGSPPKTKEGSSPNSKGNGSGKGSGANSPNASSPSRSSPKAASKSKEKSKSATATKRKSASGSQPTPTSTKKSKPSSPKKKSKSARKTGVRLPAPAGTAAAAQIQPIGKSRRNLPQPSPPLPGARTRRLPPLLPLFCVALPCAPRASGRRRCTLRANHDILVSLTLERRPPWHTKSPERSSRRPRPTTTTQKMQ